MNSNKFVGGVLIFSVALAVFIALVISPVDEKAATGWYTFDGLLYMIFGIWGGIKLLNVKK